jgi:hypothetical protein
VRGTLASGWERLPNMTAHKHLKQFVCARMLKTGVSYSSARREVIRQPTAAPPDPIARWHFPGNIPATTALRILLTHAGIRAPHTGEPYTEAMLFGVAAGIGAASSPSFTRRRTLRRSLSRAGTTRLAGDLQRRGLSRDHRLPDR